MQRRNRPSVGQREASGEFLISSSYNCNLYWEQMTPGDDEQNGACDSSNGDVDPLSERRRTGVNGLCVSSSGAEADMGCVELADIFFSKIRPDGVGLFLFFPSQSFFFSLPCQS